MKSLNTYSKCSLSFVNSIQSRIENPVILEEYALVAKHGKSIDTVFEKLNKYTYRLSNPSYITESDKNVYFGIDEQFAIRDMLISISTSYQQSLIREFCNEHDIHFENNIITEAFDISSMTNALSKRLNDAGEKVKGALAKLKGKLAAVGEFIKSVFKNAIKTAKDLFTKFTEMMVTFGGNVKDLVNKLTNNEADEYAKTFTSFTKQISDQEAKNKGKGLNTYESLANKINAGEQITESYLAEIFPILENEYADAAKAKAGKAKKGMNPILQVVLQLAAYHLTVTVIPLIIFIASGGTLGWLSAFISDIAAVAWGSVAFYKQCRHIYNVIRSQEFKQRTFGYKTVTIFWWLFCLIASAMAISKGAQGLWDKFKHLAEGGKLSHILPSETILKWAERVNEWRKQWFGKTDNLECLDHYKEILQQKDMETIAKLQEAASKAAEEYGQDGKELMKEFSKKSFDNSMDAVNWLKEHGIDKDILSNLDPNTKVYVYADGAIGNNKWTKGLSDILGRKPEGTDGFNQGLNNMNSNAGASTVIEMTYGEYLKAVDAGVMGHNNHSAVIGVAKEVVDNVPEPAKVLVGQHINFAGLMPIVQKAMKRGGFKMRLGSGRTKGHIYLIPDGDFVKAVPYSQFVNDYSDKNPKAIKEMQKYFNQNFELAKKAKETLESKEKLSKDEKKKLKAINEFIERCKEGKSEFEVLVFFTNDKYATTEVVKSKKRVSKKEVKEALIESGCTIEETAEILENIVFDYDNTIDIYEIEEGFMDKIKGVASKVINKVSDTVHKLKYKKGVSKEDVERMNREDEEAREKSKKKNDDSEESSDDIDTGEQYPLMFFNPLILCGGDLAPRERTKGPRAHIYMAKGLLSRIELLPIDNGMSAKEIFEMFGNMLKEGLKACYDVTFDVPCYKDGRKFVENTDSEYKDKERMDFGGLTNKQITDFMNDDNLAYKYLGGEFATDTISGGKHKYIEQDDTEEKKAHNKEVIEDFKKLIATNENILKFIKSTKTLSKVLFDKKGNLKEDRFAELLRSFMRVENTYLKGDEKNGLLKTVVNFFKKEIDPDPAELKELSLKLAEERKKMLKKKVKESYGEEYYNIILEANIELFESEFETLLNDDYKINEEFNYVNLIEIDE